MTKSSMVLTYKTILCIMYNEPRDLFLSLYIQHIYVWFFAAMLLSFIFKVVGCCCWAVHFRLFLLLRFAMHLSAMHHCSNNKMHIMFGLLCIPSFIWLSFLSPFLCCFVLYVHAHCICVIFTFEIDSSNVQTVWGKLWEHK